MWGHIQDWYLAEVCAGSPPGGAQIYLRSGDFLVLTKGYFKKIFLDGVSN